MSFFFCGMMSHPALSYVALLSFGLYLLRMNYIVSILACFFHTWYRRPSLFNIEFVHNGSYIFTSYLYPKKYM